VPAEKKEGLLCHLKPSQLNLQITGQNIQSRIFKIFIGMAGKLG
jgi:hypothetical protein